MIVVLLFLNFLLMLALPLVLGWWIQRRWRPGWRLFGIGAATFVVSQIFHIPFNWLVLKKWQLIPADTAVLSNLILLSLFLGLSAGVFEEGARYLTYRFWAKDARSWAKGVMLGAGHGGIEALLLGAVGMINFVALLALRQGYLSDLIPPAQMDLVQSQIEAMFGIPWYMGLLGAVERLFALTLHLALSLLVMQVFVRGKARWLAAAVLWHALVNATAVFAVTTWGALTAEGLIGIMALISLGIIYWLYQPEPQEPEAEPLPDPALLEPAAAPPTQDALERSKYL
ncbi:MAG TPA: YhfC family intramembrane metalloprotease [Chloroflexi bacterium]|nr:YhfC family intramembrane metalloprotease [Chloroflexota bacterium]